MFQPRVCDVSAELRLATGGAWRLVNVAVVALVGAKRLDVGPRRIRAESALLSRDFAERAIHVFGHRVGGAADVDLRTVLQPRPDLGSAFAHQVLHVDLLLLVAG